MENYKNFSEYWTEKKDLLTQFHVTRVAAELIWSDAIDLAIKTIKSNIK